MEVKSQTFWDSDATDVQPGQVLNGWWPRCLRCGQHDEERKDALHPDNGAAGVGLR